MSVASKGRCIVGKEIHHFSFDNWLPFEIPPILIGINPTVCPNELLLSGCSSWGLRWRNENLLFDIRYRAPMELCVQPVSRWGSQSDGSSSLYPWWIHMKGQNGTPPINLICQIQPQGVSSRHMHEPEPGINVSEEYGPIWNAGGETKLKIGNDAPRTLTSQQSIAPLESHQLIREAPGFSVHLLLMRSYKYRFPNREGHMSCC
jgi:hypothetical protein